MKTKLFLAILALAQPNASLAANVLPLAGSVLVSFDNRNEGGLFGSDSLIGISYSTVRPTIRGFQESRVLVAIGERSAFTSDSVQAGTLFQTMFDPADWTETGLTDKTPNCSVRRPLVGIRYTASLVDYATINTDLGTCYLEPTTGRAEDSRNITLPEPGSISLLATGLVGLAGLICRKTMHRSR